MAAHLAGTDPQAEHQLRASAAAMLADETRMHSQLFLRAGVGSKDDVHTVVTRLSSAIAVSFNLQCHDLAVVRLTFKNGWFNEALTLKGVRDALGFAPHKLFS